MHGLKVQQVWIKKPVGDNPRLSWWRRWRKKALPQSAFLWHGKTTWIVQAMWMRHGWTVWQKWSTMCWITICIVFSTCTTILEQTKPHGWKPMALPMQLLMLSLSISGNRLPTISKTIVKNSFLKDTTRCWQVVTLQPNGTHQTMKPTSTISISMRKTL